MKKKPLLLPILLFLCLGTPISCGDRNAFAPLAPPTPAEEATTYLEKENPDGAITLILNTLGDTYEGLYKIAATGYNNQDQLHTEMLSLIADDSIDNVPNLVSILASAQAQKYKVDPFAMVLQLAKNQASTSGTALAATSAASLSTLTQLYPILPKPTSANIIGLQAALNLMQSMGNAYMTKADHLKMGLFLTANMVLELKLIDTNEDGTVSPAEIAAIAEENASIFLATLQAAVSSIIKADLTSSKINSASSALGSLQSTLQGQSGDTNADKVKNFLAQAQAQKSSP